MFAGHDLGAADGKPGFVTRLHFCHQQFPAYGRFCLGYLRHGSFWPGLRPVARQIAARGRLSRGAGWPESCSPAPAARCRGLAGGRALNSTADMDGNRSVGGDSTLPWPLLRRQPYLPRLHSTRADALFYEPPQRCQVSAGDRHERQLCRGR